MAARPPSFEIAKIEGGWADVLLRNAEGEEFGGPISDLSDGLREFITAVELVAAGRLFGAICGWAVEPGHWLVTIRLVGVQTVSLSIGYVDDDLRQPPTMRDALFSATIDVRDLARDVVRAYEGVLARYGVDGYAQRWEMHPSFPQAEVDALRAWLESEVA